MLLFAVFSIPAAAADLDLAYKAHLSVACDGMGVGLGQMDISAGETGVISGVINDYNLDDNFYLRSAVTIANVDSSVLLPAGNSYELILENFSFYVSVADSNGDNHSLMWGKDPGSDYRVTLTYSDGSSEFIGVFTPSNENVSINNITGRITTRYTVNAERDITKITFRYQLWPDIVNDSVMGTVQITSGFELPLKFSITEEDKNTGLLEGLLAWVKNIGEKVSDSFDVINYGFANIGTWFAELPSKIWSVMENGIKGLFVPDQQYMESYSNKWEQLLSDRLGAVYQVCDITLNSWDAIMHADETNTITFPLVTIPLPDNASFSFGGYAVKIVPDGFSALATAVKSAVGILCTYLFVNGLMKRYEEVMGVKE